MGSLWNRSGMVERYADDLRAAGAKAYFYAGGTTTQLTVFADSGEASAHPFPVVADANGRWPDVFVPYTVSFDVRVTSADNVQLTYTQRIPNPDPVDQTVVVDPLNTVQTGMIHAELVNTVKSGYVRLNGRTLGNGASSATERANADTAALFAHLWNNVADSIAPVSSGRGGSAAADYAANKTITLPDWRGAMPVGVDDMGNSAAGNFGTLSFIVGTAITPGSYIGDNTRTLVTGNLPSHVHTGTTATTGSHSHTGTTNGQSQSHTHTGTTDAGGAHSHTASSSSDGSHTHSVNVSNNTLGGVTPAPTSGSATPTTNYATSSDGSHSHTITVDAVGTHTHTFTSGNASQDHNHTFTTDVGGSHAHGFTTDATGSDTGFNNMPRSSLVTWFIKL